MHRSICIQTDTYSCHDNFTGQIQSLQEKQGYAIITTAEMIYLLENAGFKDIRTFNGWNARSSEPIKSEQIIITGCKPHWGVKRGMTFVTFTCCWLQRMTCCLISVNNYTMGCFLFHNKLATYNGNVLQYWSIAKLSHDTNMSFAAISNDGSCQMYY